MLPIKKSELSLKGKKKTTLFLLSNCPHVRYRIKLSCLYIFHKYFGAMKYK